jgi:O-antigen ligase
MNDGAIGIPPAAQYGLAAYQPYDRLPLDAESLDQQDSTPIGLTAWALAAGAIITSVFSAQEGLNWIPQVASLGVAAVWLAVDVFVRRQPVKLYPFYIFMLLWMAWETLANLGSSAPIGSVIDAMLSTLKVLALSWLASNIVRDRSKFIALSIGLILPPLILLVMFRDQASAIADQLSRGIQNDDLRFGGEFGNQNSLSLNASYALIAIAWLFFSIKNRFLRPVSLAPLPIVMYYIALNGSRTGFAVVVLLAIGLWFFHLREMSHGRRGMGVMLFIVGIVLAGAAIGWILTSPFAYRFKDVGHDYAHGRFALAVMGLKLFLESPILGHGTFGFGERAASMGTHLLVAHNQWVELLVTSGLVGLSLYLAGWITALLCVWRVRRLPLSMADRTTLNIMSLCPLPFFVFTMTGTLMAPRFAWIPCGALIGFAYTLRERAAKAATNTTYGEVSDGSGSVDDPYLMD